MKEKKILLIQLYSNGDCLYATAVARQIKKDFPGCHLTWAIAGFCKNILNNNPDVDAVLEVNEVRKNDVPAYRRFKRKILKQKAAGKWDEVFFTQNMDSNVKYYDGTIRGMILRAYPGKVEDVQPELRLTQREKNNVKEFATKYQLQNFTNVILWEYAPQSGQSDLTFDFVMKIAERITQIPDTCIILTSANKFRSTEKIFDASELTIRENAELTHYCSLLIGCSSGITWICTSTAAKLLPMIQLLNPAAPFRNIPSVDFKRYDLNLANLTEIFNFDENKVFEAVKLFIAEGMPAVKNKFDEELRESFLTTKGIVYNLLCYGNFSGIQEHIHIMKTVTKNQQGLKKAVAEGIKGFPKKLVRNIYRKRIAPKLNP